MIDSGRLRFTSLNRGFTLIELLMVVAIIGLLTAIAIPQFISYRERAVDSQVKTDLKNAAVAMESYFSEHQVYPSSSASIVAAGFRQTAGVTLTINLISPTSFTITASKPGATQPSFVYLSTTGQIN
jgi:type IV pilus assembly protein PilA